MYFATADSTVAARIARSHTDRHSQQGSGFKSLVKVFQGLLRPGYFRRAPADADDGWLVVGVMHGGGDRVQESLVRIRGKINHDTGPRRYGPRHFDVQHYLSVRAIDIRGAVGCSIYGDGFYRRRGHTKSRKISIEIRIPETAPSFNDNDAM